MNTLGTYDHTDYNAVMAEVGAQSQFKLDVVTLATSLRTGRMGLSVHPVGNGFIISAGNETFIAKKASEVGLLVKALYSGDLENEAILARLRRLTSNI